jgi:hypothetical protein
MSYFIFLKNSKDLPGTLYRIAENEEALNNLNIVKSDYKIIEDTFENFENVKYGLKYVLKHNDNTIIYSENSLTFDQKEQLQSNIDNSLDPVVLDDTKLAVSYLNYVNNFKNLLTFEKKEQLQNYVNNFKDSIKKFTDTNLNHPLYNQWNNYYNQLNNLNLDNIIYPLEKSLEQYFKDLGQPSFNPLQIP